MISRQQQQQWRIEMAFYASVFIYSEKKESQRIVLAAVSVLARFSFVWH
jgi:ribonuclease HIII